MSNVRMPRRGSMAVWPRKRARKSYPRIRRWSNQNFEKASLLGFAGYKAGMTHLQGIDNKKTSPTKDEEISMPVTVVPTSETHGRPFSARLASAGPERVIPGSILESPSALMKS